MTIMLDIPKVLYKFRTFEGYGKDFLLKYEMFAASPSRFNDPFDIGIPYRYDPKTYNLESYTQKFVSRHTGPMNSKTMSELINKAAERYSYSIENPDDYIAETRDAIYDGDSKFYGVVSFANTFNNILMWSHYANYHKGYCLGFDTNSIINFIVKESHIREFRIEPVQYMDEYPLLDFDDSKLLENAIAQTCSKSKLWEYEDEYRLIFMNNADLKINYPKESIRSIYLGCKMPQEDKNEILKFIKTNKLNIDIFEAEMSLSKFELDFKKVNF